MGLGEETSVGPEERGKKIHSRDVEKADFKGPGCGLGHICWGAGKEVKRGSDKRNLQEGVE